MSVSRKMSGLVVGTDSLVKRMPVNSNKLVICNMARGKELAGSVGHDNSNCLDNKI